MNKITSSEITPYDTYINRRKFIKNISAISIGSSLSLPVNALHSGKTLRYDKQLDEKDELNTYEEITTYNKIDIS